MRDKPASLAHLLKPFADSRGLGKIPVRSADRVRGGGGAAVQLPGLPAPGTVDAAVNTPTSRPGGTADARRGASGHGVGWRRFQHTPGITAAANVASELPRPACVSWCRSLTCREPLSRRSAQRTGPLPIRAALACNEIVCRPLTHIEARRPFVREVSNVVGRKLMAYRCLANYRQHQYVTSVLVNHAGALPGSPAQAAVQKTPERTSP